jgi:hypothetical protein
MEQLIDNLHLFNKVSHMLVPEPFLLDILLDRHLLTQPFTQVHLAISAFSDRFYYLDLLFRNEEVQLYAFFGHVLLYLGLHVLLWSGLLALSALFLPPVLFLSLLFLFLFLAVG